MDYYITKKTTEMDRKLLFKEVEVGQVFDLCGILYIKTECFKGTFCIDKNAVDLGSGKYRNFGEEDSIDGIFSGVMEINGKNFFRTYGDLVNYKTKELLKGEAH